jgi:hypothetical protein
MIVNSTIKQDRLKIDRRTKRKGPGELCLSRPSLPRRSWAELEPATLRTQTCPSSFSYWTLIWAAQESPWHGIQLGMHVEKRSAPLLSLAGHLAPALVRLARAPQPRRPANPSLCYEFKFIIRR